VPAPCIGKHNYNAYEILGTYDEGFNYSQKGYLNKNFPIFRGRARIVIPEPDVIAFLPLHAPEESDWVGSLLLDTGRKTTGIDRMRACR
jgi:hypothetical protein